MSEVKYSCNRVEPTELRRPGGWEVSHPSHEDPKQLCTVLFCGPEARERAMAYVVWMQYEDLLR